MISTLRRLIQERSIVIQLGAVLLVGQAAAQLAAIAFVFWRFERPDVLRTTSVATVEAIAFFDVLRTVSPEDRAEFADRIGKARPAVGLIPSSAAPGLSAQAQDVDLAMRGLIAAAPELALRARLVASGATSGVAGKIALDLGEGQSLVFEPQLDQRTITLPRAIVTLQITSTLIPLAVLALWAFWMLISPLARLARESESFVADLHSAPLAERGPWEIRQLAHALNTMRERVSNMVESRQRTLAAISHDLRTPLTRIQLRVEGQAEGADRDRTLRDLDTMTRMISQALLYLRGETRPLRMERTQLSSLISTICDDFADAGLAVSFTGDASIVVECEPDLMTRAISNLLDNASKFGRESSVEIRRLASSEVEIRVIDDGPGIPDQDKEAVFDPFIRRDEARARNHQEGFGLGLSIARQIIERHGGSITLHDRHPHGLEARVVLPAGPSWTQAHEKAGSQGAIA